ncbi:MAG TPA: helix-hairpin-helix domain-containing protein [Bacteroidia bacterium]|nr:helix-hairpin-helix domain-containing protein [Bacteroidia bacterium]
MKDTVPQDDPLQQQIEDLSENLSNENADYTTLTDNLRYYQQHPLNLNTASREELEDLMLLDEVQIDNLLAHRDKFGPLMTIYELQSIDGFDLATIYKILPYVKVSDNMDSGHFSFHEMRQNGHHEIVLRDQRVIETQKGFSPIDSAALAASPNSRYLGSPDHLYARYRFTYGNYVSVGFTADKDPGEQFFRGTQKQGFDFYSGHVCVRNISFVKTAVIGDYQVGFGQGLTAWTGYAFGKTSMVINTKRNATGIRPYTSVEENKFLRGAAATVRFGHFETSAFFSYNHRDANIALSDTTGGKNQEVLEVSSLQVTGLHTTPSEVADKDAITEMIFGGNVSYNRKRFHLGVTGMHSEYSANLVRGLSLYNQFEFSAQHNTIAGADYDWSFHNFHFFGEGAMSANGGYAFVNGVLISLDPRLIFTVHQRWFDKNFQNLYANVFSESTTIANEKGIYFGMMAKPLPRFTISTYVDHFIFPWLKYQVNAPSSGNDFLVQVNFTPDKKTDMYFRYRHRDKFTNAGDSESPIDYIIPYAQDNYRFNIQYPAGASLRLRNRVEYSQYYKSNGKPEKGFVIYQDVTYHRIGSRLSFSARYALFQTDSYNAAIYTYENDMPYTFSIPAYYYKGSRVYLLVNWDISRNVELYFRISQTMYYDRNVISPGSLTEIDGNTKTEAKMMLRIKF